MPEVSFDLESVHPLLPHPAVTKLHEENKFPYDKTLQDRNYAAWYENTKKVGKISTGEKTIVISQMIRTNQMGQDYIYYDATLYGTDTTGNRLGFDMRFGKYDKPIFRKKIDQRTDEIISHEIMEQVITYEYQYSPELFDSLLEKAIEGNPSLGQGLNLVVVTPGRNYTITDPQDFRDATYQELIEIGKTAKSLADIRKEKEAAPTTAATAVVQTKK